MAFGIDRVMPLAPIALTLKELAVPLVGCIVLALLFAAAASKITHESFRTIFMLYAAFSIPIALIAYVAGDATGISRAPAVGNVVPAVLAFIGGVNVYVFGSETKNKVVIGYCAAVFAVMFSLGLQNGSLAREDQQEEYLAGLSEAELRIRNLRENLGLPPTMPPWVLGGTEKK